MDEISKIPGRIDELQKPCFTEMIGNKLHFLSGKGRYVLVFFFFVVSCTISGSRDAESYARKAVLREEKNDLEGAIKLVNKAIVIDSNESMFYVLRGRIKIRIEKYDSAIVDFNHALLLNNKNTAAYYYMGLAYSFSNREQLAIMNFNNAINSKNRNGFVFETQNIDKLSFKNQTDIPINILRFHRGESYYKLENDSMAIADFEFSGLYDYEKAESFVYLGLLYLPYDAEKACMYFQKASQSGNDEAKRHLQKFCNK